MGTLKVAVCQMRVAPEKEKNLAKAKEMINVAVEQGAQMVILPECFNTPYDNRLFPQYAEAYPGPTTRLLAKLARQKRIILVGGSIPEKDSQGRIYNSSYTFDEKGNLIGKHRKIHLFDIDIPGQITFRESSTLSPGNNLKIIKHPLACFAVIICYDCRFPELCRMAALEGANLLIVPAAFNATTGAVHWELLMRCRAVDNQLYVIGASPALDPEADYQAWGHSMVVDPWGIILNESGRQEEVLLSELDFSRVVNIRKELPLLQHRRTDLYTLNFHNCSPGPLQG